MSNTLEKEKLIKELYEHMTKSQLPDVAEEKPYYFDESTGTWYMMTGRSQIDRPSIECAKKYFEDVLRPISGSLVGTPNYEKALYCAIAVEAINNMLK